MTVLLHMWTQSTWACCSESSIPACFFNWAQLCERSVLWSLENRTDATSDTGSTTDPCHWAAATLSLAAGYLSGGPLSNCLDVIPGNEEMERDDSRDCRSDVSSGLSMSVKTHHRLAKMWPRLSSNNRGRKQTHRSTSGRRWSIATRFDVN